MSARARTQTVDALFEGCGGYDRALQWIKADDENYGKFFVHIWAKGVERSVHMEHGMDDGMEAALARLDTRPAPAVEIVPSTSETPVDAEFAPSAAPTPASDNLWGDPIHEDVDS